MMSGCVKNLKTDSDGKSLTHQLACLRVACSDWQSTFYDTISGTSPIERRDEQQQRVLEHKHDVHVFGRKDWAGSSLCGFAILWECCGAYESRWDQCWWDFATVVTSDDCENTSRRRRWWWWQQLDWDEQQLHSYSESKSTYWRCTSKTLSEML